MIFATPAALRRVSGVAVVVAIAALATAIAYVGGHGVRPIVDRAHPNVVLMTMDTTRRDHLTFYGYPKDTTPRLQELMADRGVVFDQAISAETNTAPAHASIFTGMYPAGHGLLRNGMTFQHKVPTLARILRAHGYATGGFVSGWTLSRQSGLDDGFETYNDHMLDLGRRRAKYTYAAALPWVRAQAKKGGPFFLFFHLFDPHFPYDPPPEDARKFLPRGYGPMTTVVRPRGIPGPITMLPANKAVEYIARYDGEINFDDEYMGRMIDELQRLGVASNTMFIFMADHGDTLYERSWIFDHGGRAYDEQIRDPLVMRFPDDRFAGRRIAQQVGQVDVLPTILDTLGLPIPPRVQGRSLLPLIEGKVPEDMSHPAFAQCRPEPIRVPEVHAPISRRGLVCVLRLPHVKLIEYPLIGGGWAKQLFDLQHDPKETRNIASERPTLVAQLHDELEAWRQRNGGAVRAGEPKLSPQARRQLRALGYIQ